MQWYMTTFAVGEDYLAEMREMLQTFRHHHPTVPVVACEYPIQAGPSWEQIVNFKAQWCRHIYRNFGHLGHLLWADVDLRFRRTVVPPTCEWIVSAKKFDKYTNGILWFRGCNMQASRLLDEWVRRAETNFEDGDEGAFNEACEVLGIEPKQIPDSVYYPCSLSADDYEQRLAVDSAIVHWKMSRKVIGGDPDWPPPEDERKRIHSL